MTDAAFFDLDKTLLPGSSLFPIARELYRRGVFGAGDIVRMALDQLAFQVIGTEAEGRIARARESGLDAIRGRSRDEVMEAGRDIVRRELNPRFYPQALELVARHKRLGREVFACSSAPQDLLLLLADDVGFDGVIGTMAEVDAHGVYTGRLQGGLCHGEEKARRVAELAGERGIDLEASYAYSDSVNDLPLLELVGNPVATNPDRHLFAVARQKGWPMLDFRAARRRALIASAAGAGAAAMGGIGYAVGYAFGRARARTA